MFCHKANAETISVRMRLSPYQSYILSQNAHKYNLDGLLKRGDILYAPYKCMLSRNTRDYVDKVLHGPRADLIGADRMLVIGRRGVRLYAAGFFRAADDSGHAYYADSMGQRIERTLLENILGL